MAPSLDLSLMYYWFRSSWCVCLKLLKIYVVGLHPTGMTHCCCTVAHPSDIDASSFMSLHVLWFYRALEHLQLHFLLDHWPWMSLRQIFQPLDSPVYIYLNWKIPKVACNKLHRREIRQKIGSKYGVFNVWEKYVRIREVSNQYARKKSNLGLVKFCPWYV